MGTEVWGSGGTEQIVEKGQPGKMIGTGKKEAGGGVSKFRRS